MWPAVCMCTTFGMAKHRTKEDKIKCLLQINEMMSRGLTQKRASSILGISHRTVEWWRGEYLMPAPGRGFALKVPRALARQMDLHQRCRRPYQNWCPILRRSIVEWVEQKRCLGYPVGRFATVLGIPLGTLSGWLNGNRDKI